MAKARQLELVFEVCRDPDDATTKVCKDYETEIKPWMKRKFMFTLENRKQFFKSKVQDEKYKEESVMTWNIISPQLRYQVYNRVSITRLDLNDNYASLETHDIIDIFDVRRDASRLYDNDDNVQFGLVYELDDDLLVISRNVYGMLDLLADLGGLSKTLYLLLFSIVSCF